MNSMPPPSSGPDNDSAFQQRLKASTPLIQKGYAYWADKGGPDYLPRRSDINPFEIPDLIRNVVIIDVLRDPLDFRYRLMGTAITDHLEMDRTGQKMSEIPFQKAPSVIWQSCSQVVSEKRPVITDVPYVGPRSEFKEAHDIVLPLFDERGDVDKLLIFVDYVSKQVA